MTELSEFGFSQQTVTGIQKARTTLLAIARDQETLFLLQSAFASEHDVLTAGDSETGLQLFFQTRPSIVLVEAAMPIISGIQVLETIMAADAAVEVVLISDHYSKETAVEAVQKGSRDYLIKPLDLGKLRSLIGTIQDEAGRRLKTAHLERELLEVYEFEGIIGRSSVMLEVFTKIRRVSPHFKTVLVSGNTGTGKELVARALHNLSPGSSKPFATVNCAALMETLLESELFGYVKGAFTGALRDKIGVFEYAQGGTVFLDEIGELPIAAQAKLLRVLQNQEVQRVGSPVPRTIDVRVIAATNRDLKKEIAKGTFREDLYYRLAMVEVALPPLVDRKEDLPLLQRHLVAKFSSQYHKEIRGMTRRAQTRLASHYWPGNVRELENVIGNACMMAEGNVIDVHDLPEPLRSQQYPQRGIEEVGIPTLEQVSQRHVLNVLQRVGGNKLRAAEALGIGRNTLYDMLARIRIKTAAVTSIDRGPESPLCNEGIG
jgi:DNA-binding NtrC family response regulator